MAKQPLEIHPGQPLPDYRTIEWDKVSEIHLFVHAIDDIELRELLTVGIKHHVMPQGKTPDALRAVDSFIT